MIIYVNVSQKWNSIWALSSTVLFWDPLSRYESIFGPMILTESEPQLGIEDNAVQLWDVQQEVNQMSYTPMASAHHT